MTGARAQAEHEEPYNLSEIFAKNRGRRRKTGSETDEATSFPVSRRYSPHQHVKPMNYAFSSMLTPTIYQLSFYFTSQSLHFSKHNFQMQLTMCIIDKLITNFFSPGLNTFLFNIEEKTTLIDPLHGRGQTGSDRVTKGQTRSADLLADLSQPLSSGQCLQSRGEWQETCSQGALPLPTLKGEPSRSAVS